MQMMAPSSSSGNGSDFDPMAKMSDQEVMAMAKRAGIDLEDPRVVKELEARAQARRDEDLKRKAEELGIDLNDPQVKQMLEEMQKRKDMSDEEIEKLDRKYV